MSKKVALVRLLSGEELVGEVVARTDEIIELKNPCLFIMQQPKEPGGKTNIGFVPWMTYTTVENTNVIIYLDNLPFGPLTLDPQLEAGYLRIVTGLVVPPASKLILPS